MIESCLPIPRPPFERALMQRSTGIAHEERERGPMNHLRLAGVALVILSLVWILPSPTWASPPADVAVAVVEESGQGSLSPAQGEKADGVGCWSVADLIESPMTPAQPRASGGGICACSQGCCSGCSCPEDLGSCCARALGEYCVAVSLCTCRICAET